MTIFREPKNERLPMGNDPPARRRGLFTAIGAAVLVLLIVLIWRSCNKPAADETAAVEVSVQVAKAEHSSISNEVAAVATLTARHEATLTPKIAAPISAAGLMVNRTVKAGDVLATLESRDLNAQRAEAAAAVVENETAAHVTANGTVPLTNAQDQKTITDARVALDNARKTYERRTTLFEQGGISKKELEASKLALTQAEDDLKLAEASVNLHHGVTNPGDVKVAQAKAQQARDRLLNLDAQVGYTIIRAPFDGVVTGQFQYQGELANPGTKMFTIADTSELIAKMQVGVEAAGRLKAGDAVSVLPDDTGGQPIPGTINLVGRGADPQTRTVEVWVLVPNHDGRLRPNGVARVLIASEALPDAVVVPSAAVTLDATNGNAGTVMVVDSKSIAHEKKVTIGRRSNGRTQIVTGLTGGETVVIEGNYGLPDGTKVVVPKEEPAASATPESTTK